jgi:lysophospholipase L1-like esterase
MKLLTVGDSFTYGEELTDRTLAWPYLVGRMLGYEVTNLAVPGTGNTQMIRSVVENYQQYDLIIIAWSHYARIEFADEYGIYDTWPGHKGVMFNDNLSFRRNLLEYINRHYSDSYLFNQYLLNIILLQNLLTNNNRNYLMLNAFGNNILNNMDFKKYVNYNLIEKIDTSNIVGKFEDTMMEWAYNCPKGPNGHFLALGHQRVADKINEHIRNLGWVS